MTPGLTTVVVRAKSMKMEYQSRRLTQKEEASARRAIELFTLPFCNICEIVYQLALGIINGAVDPSQAHLTVTPQVVTGLATLQSAVQDLSRAYIAHTNTVIGKGAGSSL
ncbi:MAG: hypothetical protein Q9207_008534, partial [Kuettlingeria erythrocarpa]